MKEIIKTTEPTLIFRIRRALLNTEYEYAATIAQGIWKRTFAGDRLTITHSQGDTAVIVSLTAADTEDFDFSRNARAQVAWIDDNGKKHATKTADILIGELLEEAADGEEGEGN